MYVSASSVNSLMPSNGKVIWCSDDDPSIWVTNSTDKHGEGGFQFAGTCISNDGNKELQRTFEVFLTFSDVEKILTEAVEQGVLSFSIKTGKFNAV